MTVKVAFIGAAVINKEIASIAKAGKKLDDRIQAAGLSVLNHVGEHGDVTVAAGLLAAMPNGSRRKALVEWMLAHGKLIVNTDKATQKELPFLHAKDKETLLEKAAETPWWEFAPEAKVLEAFDFQAALKQLLARADREAAKGVEIKGEKALEQARKLVQA